MKAFTLIDETGEVRASTKAITIQIEDTILTVATSVEELDDVIEQLIKAREVMAGSAKSSMPKIKPRSVTRNAHKVVEAEQRRVARENRRK